MTIISSTINFLRSSALAHDNVSIDPSTYFLFNIPTSNHLYFSDKYIKAHMKYIVIFFKTLGRQDIK